ncbi:MAG: hypothetical protein WC238_05385 [Parcubacteria group bacterium]|jgi:hypothetical protein
MTLKSYIWGMRLVTLFSILAFAAVIKYVDPEATGVVGKILFYLVLFFALSGLLNLVLLWLRRKITNSENAFANVGLSFRQSALLAILAEGLLVMQSLRVLIWWDGLLLLAGIFLIELYFLSKD